MEFAELKIMPKSREHLRDLVKEAIPHPDAGVVNFRALRDVLAASIDHPEALGIKNSSSLSSAEHAGDDEANGKDDQNHPSSKTDSTNNNIRELTSKLDLIVDRFDVFTQDLSEKIQKIDNRVTKLEEINKIEA